MSYQCGLNIKKRTDVLCHLVLSIRFFTEGPILGKAHPLRRLRRHRLAAARAPHGSGALSSINYRSAAFEEKQYLIIF